MTEQGAYASSNIWAADRVIEGSSNHFYWLTNAWPTPRWLDENNHVDAGELRPGRGYWYNRAGSGAFTWSEDRPYADVFPSNGVPPAVTGMTFNISGTEAVLSIATLGQTGEVLDIFYQDVPLQEGLNTTSGWVLADASVPVNGQTSLTWVDRGSSNRLALPVVDGRFYLVGRADVDGDGDGLSDAREIFMHHHGCPVLTTTAAIG